MTGTTAAGRGWADGWAAPALVAAVTVLVFWRSLSGDFVWDDHLFLESRFVDSPGSWLSFFTDAGAADPLGFVRPLRTMEYALDHALWRSGAALFHVHSLLWHVAGSVLFLLILRRLLGDGRAALAAALFWAIHPVQVESVAWIACRGDVAMGACSMAAVLFALRSEGLDRNFAISLAAASVALLYKEAAITLWVVIATLRWLRLTRVPVWPYVVVAAAFLVYRQSVQTGPLRHVNSFVLGGSFAGTVATMIRAFGFYVAQALVPAQSLDWYMTPSTSFADTAVLAWLAVHAALVVSAIVARTRAPLWTLAVAWFYAFLVPVANWPVFLGIPTAERYLYLSLAGVAIAVGWAATRASRGAWPAIVVVLAALGTTSFARTGMWANDDSLWDAVLADHESPKCCDHFAKELRTKALALQRDGVRTRDDAQRATAASRVRSLLEQSLDEAHRAVALWCAFEGTDHEVNPLARSAELTASNDCHRLGRNEEALFHAEEAIRIDAAVSRFADFDRAQALAALDFPAEAIDSMRRARALGSGRPDAETAAFFRRAAAACRERHLLAAARSGYEAAVEASPDGPQHLLAQSELAALEDRMEPDAEERRLLALSAQTLAALPRACPARRDRTAAK